MSGLFHTLGIGAESLYVSRQGVDTTGHNISNAQQPGYSRQRLNLATRDPLQRGNILMGNGAYVKEIGRVHDQFVENQINVAGHELGMNVGKFDALKGLENIFSPELSASVQDEVNSLFSALRDFSNNPEELAARTSLKESATNVASAFGRVDASLRRSQGENNDLIAGEVKDINDMIGTIATLNAKIGEMEVGISGPANDLRDQREMLVRDLSQKMEIRHYEDKSGGLVIRGPGETTLVEGPSHAFLSVQRNQEGMFSVTASSFDNKNPRVLDDKIEMGKLRALLDVRDKTIPGLISKNNEMASTITSSFNEIHREGFGIGQFSGVNGRDFFKESEDPRFAAQQMQLTDAVMASTDAISGASSPHAPGDNVVANGLIALQSEKLFDEGNATISEYYSGFVSNLGLDIQRADHIREASQVIYTDLNARREAISGVSLDEEATNLLKWQHCFSASSKLITTVDEMLDTVLNLKRV